MQPPTGANRLVTLVVAAAVIVLVGGCDAQWQLYDAAALGSARKLLVMPAVGAPGSDGPRVGPVQTGLLITVLDQTGRFTVEGPCQSRQKTIAEAGMGQAVWDQAFQADLADQLDVDLLVVSEVFDFRATTQYKSAWYYVGESNWTESTYCAGVSLRLISPADGRLVYFGMGEGASQLGYGPALLDATRAALIGVTNYLAANPAPQAYAEGGHP